MLLLSLACPQNNQTERVEPRIIDLGKLNVSKVLFMTSENLVTKQ